MWYRLLNGSSSAIVTFWVSNIAQDAGMPSQNSFQQDTVHKHFQVLQAYTCVGLMHLDLMQGLDPMCFWRYTIHMVIRPCNTNVVTSKQHVSARRLGP